MSLQVEKLDHNMAKLTIEAAAEDFEKAVQQAYLKNRGKISVPGFRKGKAPRALIEKMYGKGVFFEDAANDLIPEAYQKAVEEHTELDIVSRPKIDVTQIESGKPFIFTAEVALKPEVELGKYKGVKCDAVDTSVTDEEVDAEIERQRQNNSRMVDVEGRAIQEKDIATIDFEGFVDGEAFEGGKGENYDLEIGSHSFIDTFEDQLIGKNAGDETEVNVTFPEDYQEKSLAGKAATFKVTVKGIKEKELPELNDEFASDVSEFETLAEFKEDTKKKIAERKENNAKAAKEDQLIQAIIDDSKMDIPDAMLETGADQLLQNYAMRLSSQGLSLDMYLQYTGMTVDRLRDQMKDQAVKNIHSRLVLEAVVAAEKLEATDEEYNNELQKMADQYKMEIDKLKDLVGDKEAKNIRTDIAIQKAVDLIVAEAKETAPEKSAE